MEKHIQLLNRIQQYQHWRSESINGLEIRIRNGMILQCYFDWYWMSEDENEIII